MKSNAEMMKQKKSMRNEAAVMPELSQLSGLDVPSYGTAQGPSYKVLFSDTSTQFLSTSLSNSIPIRIAIM